MLQTNNLRDFLYKLMDLPQRLKWGVRRSLKRELVFSREESKSDSESGSYVDLIESLFNNEALLSQFRRNYQYRRILEHVDWKLGTKYLERIEALAPGHLYRLLRQHEGNDGYGNPLLFNLQRDLKVSCTTIRYVCVLVELLNLVKINSTTKVVEIGVGYGGQAAILNRHLDIREYTMFDLTPVQRLASHYLEQIESPLKPQFMKLEDVISNSWDLVISNYAFSELPAGVQTKYLEKVLKKSNSGYLIMNSGRTNKSGRSDGKLTAAQLLAELPKAKISEEVPNSGPDNYVIAW